jgi:hypothetical protein
MGFFPKKDRKEGPVCQADYAITEPLGMPLVYREKRACPY